MAKKPAAAQPQSEPKRGAKPLAPVVLSGDLMDDSKLADRGQQLAAKTDHQQALVQQFGDGLPWHPEHYEAAIRIEIGRSAESFLRAGRMLLVARACSVHGEWASMLKRLNLGDDTALHMMAWARQVAGLANPERVRDLQAAASTIGKMIALSKLPDDQFKALAEEGRTGELDLDDVASMTRDELRAAVREARANAEAKDQRITKLSDDVNKAEEKASLLRRAKPDKKAGLMLAELETAFAEARTALRSVANGAAQFLDYASDHSLDFDEDVSARTVELDNMLLALVMDLRIRGINQPHENALVVLGGA